MPEEEPEKLEWSKEPLDGWLEEVDGWEWKFLGNDHWEKSGPCLRCTHELTVTSAPAHSGLTVDPQVEEALDAHRAPATESDRAHRVLAWCDCPEEHPGRPSTLELGCGQRGWIDPPT
jgi:hypothetical protein